MKTTNKNYHSPHSPSALKNWDERNGGCAHYEQADGPDHVITQEGNAIHEWNENEAFLRWGAGEASDIDLDLVQRVNNDPELRGYGEWCMGFLTSQLGECLVTAEVLLEERFQTPFPTCNGRADMLVMAGDRASLVDWKTGFRYQGDAEGNLQGLAYAAGVFARWAAVESVTIFFVYPRLQEVTYAVITRSDLAWVIPKIGTVIGRRQQAEEDPGTVPYNQGSSCEFCDKKGSCPAWIKTAGDALNVNPPLPKLAKPNTWDPKALLSQPCEMGKALDVMDTLADYHKELKNFAHLAAAEGDLLIPGRKLVNMKGKLTITNPVKAVSPAELPSLIGAGAVTVSAPKLAKWRASKEGLTEAKVRAKMITEGIASVGANFTQLRKASPPRKPTLK